MTPNAGAFRKGEKKPGQGKHGPQKSTIILKEAILLAAEQAGEDGKGKDGLTGYLRRVAAEDVKAFASLLGKVLPLQITGAGDGPVQIARIELAPLVAASTSPLPTIDVDSAR